MLQPVDTKSPTAVYALSRRVFDELFPGARVSLLDRGFDDIEKLFKGKHRGYLPVDLGYHNLEHTLQATVCLTFLLEGAQLSGTAQALSSRQFEVAILTALLHDTGYLKIRSDDTGTGAKYTFTHVLRSCSFAASYLPTVGIEEHEIATVLSAINCTGPTHEIGRLVFNTPADRFIGCALATADYLGQMAAPDYADKLDVLYGEFVESDNFLSVPASRRAFHSAQELMEKTPDFWTKFIRPRLDTQLEGAYRYLARPYPDGPNVYLHAVEKNIEAIRQRLAANALQAR